METIISMVVAFLVAAVAIFIVSKLNLGLSVAGFGSAIVAAIVIAVVGAVVLWLLGLLGVSMGGGIIGAIIYLIVAAIILMISDRFLSGLSVSGFVGAVVAAIAIGVVTWIVIWLLGLLGIDVETAI